MPVATSEDKDESGKDRDCYSVFEGAFLFVLYCILTCLFWTASTIAQFLLLFGVSVMLIQKECERWSGGVLEKKKNKNT